MSEPRIKTGMCGGQQFRFLASAVKSGIMYSPQAGTDNLWGNITDPEDRGHLLDEFTAWDSFQYGDLDDLTQPSQMAAIL